MKDNQTSYKEKLYTKMLELRAAGYSYTGCAAKLNTDGYTTITGKKFNGNLVAGNLVRAKQAALSYQKATSAEAKPATIGEAEIMKLVIGSSIDKQKKLAILEQLI